MPTESYGDVFLDFSENMTLRHIPFTIRTGKELNSFIVMFDYVIYRMPRDLSSFMR